MSLLSILVASLLGSPHCAAMCGGFVVLYSQGSTRRWGPHLWYNAGRLVTYSVLGALAGLLGKALTRAGTLVGVQRGAAIILGALLIVVGLWQLRAFFAARAGKLSPLHSWLTARFRGLVLLVDARHASLRAFVVGLLSTLLPCGWLYSFAAVAAATGTVPSAVLVMVVFWLGTLPMMMTLGAFAQRLLLRWGAQLPVISASLIILTGVLALAGHFDLVAMHGAGHGHHHHGH